MTLPKLPQDPIHTLIDIAQAAGQATLPYWRTNTNVQTKADQSPLTAADLAAHRLISERLNALQPRYPILSEESQADDIAQRHSWPTYWLIDPLDGTKEFIKGSTEFTINIALIHQHRPILGVVHAPAIDPKLEPSLAEQDHSNTWVGLQGKGSYKLQPDGQLQPIQVRRPIKPSDQSADRPITIIGSRSHANAPTQAFIDHLDHSLGNTQIRASGSSIKFCRIAEGSADVYPRLGPTSEWDTAAAQCVVEQAGGQVLDEQLQPLRYNLSDSLLNPHFLVIADPDYPWQQALAAANASSQTDTNS